MRASTKSGLRRTAASKCAMASDNRPGIFASVNGEVVVRLGKIGFEAQSLFVVRDGVGQPSGHLRQGIGEVVVRLGKVRA
jgi:hypothetical protein